jgi:hypothetical protein
MQGFKRWISIGIILASSCSLKAQDADSLFTSPSDSLLTYGDSLSIFNLIDSLFMLEQLEPQSQLAVRLGYNSNVLSTGRTLGIEQFGLSPAVSFYHKSGFYADVTGYWSKDFEPSYYLTILSTGYLHTFSKYFSLIGSYDRYLYNASIDDQYIAFKNMISVTPYVDYKFLSFRFDYSFYFGDQTAHRIMPSLSVKLTKRNFLKIEKISFIPGAYLLFGNEKSSELVFDNNGITYSIVENNVFGVMNYAFTFPLYVTHKDFSVYVGYTYNIPKKLSTEIAVPPKSGYISAGITYYINLRPNKLSL